VKVLIAHNEAVSLSSSAPMMSYSDTNQLHLKTKMRKTQRKELLKMRVLRGFFLSLPPPPYSFGYDPLKW
jgi:hypothetical protein